MAGVSELDVSGSTVTASSTLEWSNGGCLPENAVDGAWHTEANPMEDYFCSGKTDSSHWLQLDLGQEYTVAVVNILAFFS